MFALKMEELDRLLKNASTLSKELPGIRSEFNRFFRKKKKMCKAIMGEVRSCRKTMAAQTAADENPRLRNRSFSLTF